MQPTVNHYVAQMQERQQAAQSENSSQAPRQARTTTSGTLAAQTEGR
jgi:hypothetical protein